MLVAPEACHESDVRCLAVRRQFVNVLLEKGLLKVVTELQDTVEDNLFGVSLNALSSCSACDFAAVCLALLHCGWDMTDGGTAAC